VKHGRLEPAGPAVGCQSFCTIWKTAPPRKNVYEQTSSCVASQPTLSSTPGMQRTLTAVAIAFFATARGSTARTPTSEFVSHSVRHLSGASLRPFVPTKEGLLPMVDTTDALATLKAQMDDMVENNSTRVVYCLASPSNRRATARGGYDYMAFDAMVRGPTYRYASTTTHVSHCRSLHTWKPPGTPGLRTGSAASPREAVILRPRASPRGIARHCPRRRPTRQCLASVEHFPSINKESLSVAQHLSFISTDGRLSSVDPSYRALLSQGTATYEVLTHRLTGARQDTFEASVRVVQAPGPTGPPGGSRAVFDFVMSLQQPDVVDEDSSLEPYQLRPGHPPVWRSDSVMRSRS